MKAPPPQNAWLLISVLDSMKRVNPQYLNSDQINVEEGGLHVAGRWQRLSDAALHEVRSHLLPAPDSTQLPLHLRLSLVRHEAEGLRLGAPDAPERALRLVRLVRATLRRDELAPKMRERLFPGLFKLARAVHEHPLEHAILCELWPSLLAELRGAVAWTPHQAGVLEAWAGGDFSLLARDAAARQPGRGVGPAKDEAEEREEAPARLRVAERVLAGRLDWLAVVLDLTSREAEDHQAALYDAAAALRTAEALGVQRVLLVGSGAVHSWRLTRGNEVHSFPPFPALLLLTSSSVLLDTQSARIP